MTLTLTTTAVAGARRPSIQISDTTPAVVWFIFMPAAQAESTTYRITAVPTLDHTQQADIDVNGGVQRSLPVPCILLEGYTIRFWDALAFAAATDDLIAVLHYTEYDA